METLLAQPRGFCAGVSRAIEIVEQALQIHGRPVYVYHEIVHNGYVVRDLANRGAVFVDEIDSIPPGSITVFSAHGVSNAIVSRARARQLRVIDATCPLVAKVHQQVQRYSRQGFEVVVIGDPGHDEVEGTLGAVDMPLHVVTTTADVDRLQLDPARQHAYVTQTTLSPDDTRAIIDALQARYPQIEGPDLGDICYATLNRQRAVRELAAQVDVVLVVGARNSSNSNRLREVAAQCGVPAYLIEEASELEPGWLEGAGVIGVTAGASAPEILVTALRARLVELGAGSERQLPGVRESVTFRLPQLHPREVA
jgi:4-hydroxy-3-methylbut-2-en-1-yl diphosphate reductase